MTGCRPGPGEGVDGTGPAVCGGPGSGGRELCPGGGLQAGRGLGGQQSFGAGGGGLGTENAHLECSIARSALGLTDDQLIFQASLSDSTGPLSNAFPAVEGGAAKYWDGNLETNVPRDATLVK